VAAKCDFPLCEICEFAKARDCPKQALTMTKHITHYGSPKIGDICPISTVSIDHFESRLLGHTFNSCFRPSSDKFFCGCIFVDHVSEHQNGFSAVETVQAKQNFEKLCLDHGAIVNNYLADNGVFKANAFVQHIASKQCCTSGRIRINKKSCLLLTLFEF